MRPELERRYEPTYSRQLTAGDVFGWYLLAAAALGALWVASEPVLTAAFAAGAASALLALVVLARTLAALDREGRGRLCLPGTGVCVEV